MESGTENIMNYPFASAACQVPDILTYNTIETEIPEIFLLKQHIIFYLVLNTRSTSYLAMVTILWQYSQYQRSKAVG
jgi:hypothetical protein